MGKASRRKAERRMFPAQFYIPEDREVLKDGEGWLWCLHCERFFQAKYLRPDDIGGKEGCAFFGECNGAGLGVDVFPWDDWPKQNSDLWEHWPKSESELSHGLHCSLYV